MQHCEDHSDSYDAAELNQSITLARWRRILSWIARENHHNQVGPAIADRQEPDPKAYIRPIYRQPRTAFRTDDGRSALAAGTALDAPIRPLAVDNRVDPVEWQAVRGAEIAGAGSVGPEGMAEKAGFASCIHLLGSLRELCCKPSSGGVVVQSPVNRSCF